MNWHEKIEREKNKPDGSRNLKRGEIKSILIDVIQNGLPEFHFTKYRNSIYYFQRFNKYGEHEIADTLHINFTLKYKTFECSISSCFNRQYDFNSFYNTGLMNTHIDLLALAKGTGAITIDEAYYFHNGKIATTTNIVKRIVHDYKSAGMAFLARLYSERSSDIFLNKGLEYLSTLNKDPLILKTELEEELDKVRLTISRLRHKEYRALRKFLIDIPGGEKRQRVEIPRLSYELLTYYCDRKLGEFENHKAKI